MQHAAKLAAENNSNAHNHDDHSHGHDHHSHGSGCGHGHHTAADELKRVSEERKKSTLTLAEKNKKKIRAVYAAKEDGNRLFKEGDYELAYKVYERGVLIINGMYDMKESDEDEMEKVECLLDLNMALTSLKKEDWTEAINCCKMALQMEKTGVSARKAYYRWSEALIGMADFEEAKVQNMKAEALKPNDPIILKQRKRIEALQKVQMDKAKIEDHKMAERMQNKLKI